MEHVTTGRSTRDGVDARRRRMRARARSLYAVHPTIADRYRTPDWLDRSFVLPVSPPVSRPVSKPGDVPGQTVPHHDADRRMTEARFVRPAGDDIDFARAIRRADRCRQATRLHWYATGLTGLALVAYLLLGAGLLLDVVLAGAAVAVAAFVVRLRLSRAPIPRRRT